MQDLAFRNRPGIQRPAGASISATTGLLPLLALLVLSLGGVAWAGTPAPRLGPPPGPDGGGEAVRPGDGESIGMPTLRLGKKKTAGNVCPVCKRPRSVCYEASKKAQQTGQGEVCPVYAGQVGEIRSAQPCLCPICRHKVTPPKQFQHFDYHESDADMCPHPTGRVRFYSNILICPSCGFAAHQKTFQEKQSQEIRTWVLAELQPQIRNVQRAKVGLAAKNPTEAQLIAAFDKQENIPDTVRTIHAYKYYVQRGDLNEAVLARSAWTAAWACRREVSSPIYGLFVADSVHRILAEMKKLGAGEKDPLEDRIRALQRIYERKDLRTADGSLQWTHFDRMVMCMIQAGYYNRLGLNTYALQLLQRIVDDSRNKVAPDMAQDPYFASTESSQPVELREREAIARRNLLYTEAFSRIHLIHKEMEYMAYATRLIQAALVKKLYPLEEAPSYIYLVGEFERRQENLSRALLWLTYAKALIDEKTLRAEVMAPNQIELMNRYVRDRGITPEPNPTEKTDVAFLKPLLYKIAQARKAMESNRAPEAAAPATGSGAASPASRRPAPVEGSLAPRPARTARGSLPNHSR